MANKTFIIIIITISKQTVIYCNNTSEEKQLNVSTIIITNLFYIVEFPLPRILTNFDNFFQSRTFSLDLEMFSLHLLDILLIQKILEYGKIDLSPPPTVLYILHSMFNFHIQILIKRLKSFQNFFQMLINFSRIF